MITKSILDDIISQLEPCEGMAYANYDEGDIYIDAFVQWQGENYNNYVTVDGVSYLEGRYFQVTGFSDLTVEAWIGDEPAEVDIDYIRNELQCYF